MYIRSNLFPTHQNQKNLHKNTWKSCNMSASNDGNTK
jgi:hypothetical protein